MGDENPTPIDLILFHRLERDLYTRLVSPLAQNPEQTKWVLSLWLWFESIGHHHFIRQVAALPGDVILRFMEEGKACLRCLIKSAVDAVGEAVDGELPLTSFLMAEPIDLGFFNYHCEVAVKGVLHVFKNVSQVIFNDADTEVVAAKDVSHIVSSFGALSVVARSPVVAVELLSSLNPYFMAWSPVTEYTSEDQRSMFITFSRGYPVTREEIVEFFNMRYGQCVEVVMIQKARDGMQAMYGRIVFTSVFMIPVVLDGKATAKFIIKGKHLWARMYLPRTE